MWWIYLIYKLSKLLYPKYSDKNRLGTRNLIFFPTSQIISKSFQNRVRTLSQPKEKKNIDFKAGAYASWKVDDVDKIEKTDGSVTYVIEVESGEKEYELTYLEDGTLIREDTEWGEHTPIAPGQTSEVKDLVKAKYPQAVILDIEEEKGGIEVEIRDGGRQKEVYYALNNGTLSWVHTMYEVERREFTTLPESVQQVFTELSGSGMVIDDVDFFETATGNYYRVEVEDRGADKYVYVAENGEMLQMKLKNYA